MNGHDPMSENRLWATYRSAPGSCAAGTAGCHSALDLAAYLEERLAVEAMERLESHLAACPACRSAVREARVLLTLAVDTAPDDVLARARELDAADPPIIRVSRERILARVGRWGFAAAASLAVCVVGYQSGAGVTDPADTALTADALTLGLFGVDEDGASALTLLALGEGLDP